MKAGSWTKIYKSWNLLLIDFSDVDIRLLREWQLFFLVILALRLDFSLLIKNTGFKLC